MIRFALRTFLTTVVLIVVLLNLQMFLIMGAVVVVVGILIAIFQQKKTPSKRGTNVGNRTTVPDAVLPGSAAYLHHSSKNDSARYSDDDSLKDDDTYADDYFDEDDDEEDDELDDDYDSYPDDNCHTEAEEKVRRKFCIRCNRSEMLDNMDWEDFKDAYPTYMDDDFYAWTADYLENVQFEDCPCEIMGEDYP